MPGGLLQLGNDILGQFVGVAQNAQAASQDDSVFQLVL